MPDDGAQLRAESEHVLVCRACSHIEPQATPHGPDGCTSTDWNRVPLAEMMGAETSVVMPHPDGGWPEVHITRTYMVHSDDPAVVEGVRHHLLEEASHDA